MIGYNMNFFMHFSFKFNKFLAPLHNFESIDNYTDKLL